VPEPVPLPEPEGRTGKNLEAMRRATKLAAKSSAKKLGLPPGSPQGRSQDRRLVGIQLFVVKAVQRGILSGLGLGQGHDDEVRHRTSEIVY